MELEDGLHQVGFDWLTLVLPGVIGGHCGEFRSGEHLWISALGVAGPLLPQRWRLNPAAHIAQALPDAALAPKPGVHVVTAEQMA